MPLHLFRSRTFSGANLLTLFLYAALRVAPFFLILNLIQVQGYPAEVAGFTFLPFTILLTLMSRWAGGLIDRVGARLPLIVGPAIAALGFVLLALPGLTAGPDQYWLTFFPGMIVLGIGMGVTVAPLTTAVMGSAPQEQQRHGVRDQQRRRADGGRAGGRHRRRACHRHLHDQSRRPRRLAQPSGAGA